jgi:hypothetical protein
MTPIEKIDTCNGFEILATFRMVAAMNSFSRAASALDYV